ncbi:hypothetical protein BJ508DRAFT_322320 [Ascobolus immersus RN42]|uniref:Uncharacterized protein n=1 Tax=Ascobolus immersus RN42 TaxID=1160509 RepID=A0A3N4IVR4_ASCIM|nr:hypothetical protein BJ508DRAFT_322320 [Ascobolus immersus RN42]
MTPAKRPVSSYDSRESLISPPPSSPSRPSSPTPEKIAEPRKRARLNSPEEQWRHDYQNGSPYEPVLITIEKLCFDTLSDATLLQNREIASHTNTLQSLVTVGGERFLRTFHPRFESTSYVGMFVHPSGYRHWVVCNPESAPTTTIGGLYVHILPTAMQPFNNPSTFSDPFHEVIDPRKVLRDSFLVLLREMFPYAVGCTVYKAGLINLIVKRGKGYKLLETLSQWPGSIGGLRVGIEELAITPTVAPVEWGMGAGASPNAVQMGSAGLKLRFGEGAQAVVAITVATHVFVSSPLSLSATQNLKEKGKRAMIKIARLEPILTLSKSRPVAWILQKTLGTCPLGKKVYLANSMDPVGTITRTYDKPSSIIPYPKGYLHDLSLVTSEHKPLPEIVPPLNGPRLNDTFADPETALGATPVFTLKHKVQSPTNPEIFVGDVMSSEQKAELVEATQYFWDKHGFTRSLLWRTEHDYTPVAGASGSVLCIGLPTERKHPVAPVLFQNYQTAFPFPWNLKLTEPRPSKQYTEDPKDLDDIKHVWARNFQLKGGFFLPEEIRSATILAQRTQPQTWSGVGTAPASSSAGDMAKAKSKRKFPSLF